MVPQINKVSEEKKYEEFDEQKLWAEMDPLAWHYSIARNSVFEDTYELTRTQILDAAERGGHDVILEAGCGTGDIIGELQTDIHRIGVDINDRFIEHCKKHHQHENMEFHELDVTNLGQWWKQFEGKFKKPLVICVNNTLNIMPEEIRGNVIAQMFEVCGSEGRCLVTYWNGNFFSHAIMNFYSQNVELCGPFDFSHVDWNNRTLHAPSGYSTHWMLPEEVQRLLRSYDVNIGLIGAEIQHGKDHINTAGLSIFAWFSADCSCGGKSYYDSEDAQTFYSQIWGDAETHIGRYDLLTDAEKSSLTKIQQISRAEEIHEENFVKLIASKFRSTSDDIPKVRILDMGCGYGGLLRRLWKGGHVWRATGCDIASKMCGKARVLNTEMGADQDIAILEESYLGVSVPDESVDLVISMDALLHVGPEGQKTAIKEAARVLRPGGWMVFCDIMQQEVVDPVEMQPIYDRIHLTKLGTVSNYQECLSESGFTKFEFEPHSENVASHYGTVREVLIEKKGDIAVSEAFLNKMEAGLAVWKELAPQNIVWGFMTAQKTEKVNI